MAPWNGPNNTFQEFVLTTGLPKNWHNFVRLNFYQILAYLRNYYTVGVLRTFVITEGKIYSPSGKFAERAK